MYSKSSGKIAPYEQKTKGWEWREKIKKDDRIDIFDTIGIWYLGTVLNVRETPDKKRKDILVGYRIYTEDGTKIDNNGRKHEGWSENYDEYIPAYSLRLQKPNSIAKFGTVYCRRNLDSEYPAVDDSPDMLLNVIFSKKHNVGSIKQ